LDARFLVDHQNTEKREGRNNRVWMLTAVFGADVEFCCGHVHIYVAGEEVGSGTIQDDFRGGERGRQERRDYHDASNSMWGRWEAKITIARKALAQIINGLPDSMNVGLRVYGHRYGLNDAKACTDTQLLVPIGPIAKAQLVDTVNKIQLKGKTPLVLSVLEATRI
jgi:hypothetical protein